MFTHGHRQLRHDLEEHTNVNKVPANNTDLDNLYPALVECFGIILLGFIAGKFSLIRDVEAKGLSTFIGTFSLPALIFVSLCQLNLDSVNWIFLAAVCIAKSVVFFSVLFIAAIISRGSNVSGAALYAIFCTQSNDFALGFPVLTAIYGKSHPEYPMYLYLLAPVSLAVLNPIGFIIMEIGKNSENHDNNSSSWKIFKKVTKSILSNPLIVMTFMGILGNLLFHSAMPSIIHDFMSTLGSAFSASALFLLGLRMVSSDGRVGEAKRNLLLPFLLVITKSLILPLVTREIISQMNAGGNDNETEALSNYGFLYGTIPTAPSVFVYATNYAIQTDMIASTITASTFMAAPLMFISAKLLMINNLDPADYIDAIDLFLFDISIIGLLASMWVVFVLLITRKGYSFPHQITLLLVICQGVGCLGAILWSTFDCRHGWKLYLQFIIFGYGVFGSRICTAVLAMTVLLQSRFGASLLVKYRKLLVGTGALLPLLIVGVLVLIVVVETERHGAKLDPNFQYGSSQAITALVVVLMSLFITVVSLILLQRSTNPSHQLLISGSTETDRLLASSSASSTVSDMEDTCPALASRDLEDLISEDQSPATPCGGGGAEARRYRCDSTHREYCSSLIRRYEVPPAEDALTINGPNSPLNGNRAGFGIHMEDTDDPTELQRHKLLLILLSMSMFVGAALCIWTLMMDRMSGIYLELVFLDGFLNLGQSIFTLAIFGISAKGIVVNCRRLTRRIVYGREKILLPSWEDLAEEDRNVSTRFIKHHLEICMEELLHDISVGLRRHQAAFWGDELTSWLIEYGLAHTRQEAEAFGRHLLRGRVIRHVDDHLDFYDGKYVYTFLPENRRTAR